MANITVHQDSVQIGNFCCYAGSQIDFADMQFVCTGDVTGFQASFPGLDAYMTLTIGATPYAFPVDVNTVKNAEGLLSVDVPSSYVNGRHIIKMQLSAVDERPLPIAGQCVAGLTPLLPLPPISQYEGITPYCMLISLEDTATGGPASSDEKDAVIAVLSDWLTDTTSVIDAATSAVNALTGSSSSADIYAAYLLVAQVRGSINAPTIIHAVYSLYEEIAEWQTI
jgi:hypothetical protein